ncbi:MAG: hypothetical protein Ct9H90mP18_02890 [Gammaproteobacteria bacterium]|nr:MAG: hypothetical protein Ct9H90mP18_02890 [Gammaproteobacteria bacterium]
MQIRKIQTGFIYHYAFVMIISLMTFYGFSLVYNLMLDSLPILSIFKFWVPIIGGLILLFLNNISEKYIRVFGHSVSLATLVFKYYYFK